MGEVGVNKGDPSFVPVEVLLRVKGLTTRGGTAMHAAPSQPIQVVNRCSTSNTKPDVVVE